MCPPLSSTLPADDQAQVPLVLLPPPPPAPIPATFLTTPASCPLPPQLMHSQGTELLSRRLVYDEGLRLMLAASLDHKAGSECVSVHSMDMEGAGLLAYKYRWGAAVCVQGQCVVAAWGAWLHCAAVASCLCWSVCTCVNVLHCPQVMQAASGMLAPVPGKAVSGWAPCHSQASTVWGTRERHVRARAPSSPPPPPTPTPALQVPLHRPATYPQGAARQQLRGAAAPHWRALPQLPGGHLRRHVQDL